MTKRGNNINIDPEYGVDSTYKTTEEREEDTLVLMEARLNSLKNLSKEQILQTWLLQLKLKMENYLSEPNTKMEYQFGQFVDNYVQMLYPKQSSFAKDVHISSNLLSKIINQHRKPNDEFILKLMIHSEKVFKPFQQFDSTIWFKIYFKEKLQETISRENNWRLELEEKIEIGELSANAKSSN